MLNDSQFKLLWSTEFDEEICKNLYDENCNKCEKYDSELDDYIENTCPYRDGYSLDYDYLNGMIEEEFNNKFYD